MASSAPGPGPGGPGPGPAGPPGVPAGPAGPSSMLRGAAARGDLQEVVRLLGEGAKLLPDEEGRTALHFSASAGHADIAAALLIAGAGVNAVDSAGCTALQRAAAEGHLDLVKQLLKHKADVNLRDNGPGNTALHEASWKGFSKCVQALCAVRGADLSLRNHAGFAPLHLACQNGHNQSCRELLLAGCDPDVRNNYGDTPLHTSARYGHAGVTRILVSAQCKVSEQNKNGDTALHIAAAMGRRKLTRILLEAGCTKSLRNKQGETARDIATRKELTEILTILNNPVIPMPRNNKDANKENNKKKKKTAAAAARPSGGRSGGRSRAARASGSAPLSGATTGTSRTSGTGWSPYGCHYYPDTKSFPEPKLDSLPAEPLRKGEQYYLDLAGNIRKGPVGVGYTCYCAPFFKHMEQRMDRDKQDLKRHINEAVQGLERRTQGHISELTRSLAAERARCSQRHLHLQQWLRGARLAEGLDGLTLGHGPPRARSVDSLLELTRSPAHGPASVPGSDTLQDAEHRDDAAGEVGDEIEVLSEGDNTARRKESFLRRRGRLRLRPGLSWDVLAAADQAMAATDPTHRAPHTPQDPLLSAARLRARRTPRVTPRATPRDNLEVLDEHVTEWRGHQRRLMLEVARASREIAQLKRVACRASSGSDRELDSRLDSRNGRESRGSRGSRSTGTGRRLQTLDQVDEGGHEVQRSVHYFEAEVHPPPRGTSAASHTYGRSRSQELLRVERAPSPPSPTVPTPCSPAARSARWHGVSVTAEDIENWRRLDRLREAREADQEIMNLANGGMINNPDYEIQVEDGMIFSSDLQSGSVRLPPLPQPQQPSLSVRSAMGGVQESPLGQLPARSMRSLSSAPPPAAAVAVLHPKPKFLTPFQRANATGVSAKPAGAPSATPAATAASAPAHVPLRKSVHDMVARIQNHMLSNLMGRQPSRQSGRQGSKAKEEAASTAASTAASAPPAPTSNGTTNGVREMAIDVGDCVQVQARRVQACRNEDSESSDGEDSVPVPGLGLGLGPDYENVTCWREADRHLVSELPYRSRTAVYSPDVDPDFLDIALSNRHHDHGLDGHDPDAILPNGVVRVNGLPHSPAGTPDLELEVHGHHAYHHFPYTGGMYSPDHGDSGYSTRLGGSSNSKGTSPSLSGLDSDGLLQNPAPRSAAALNIANAAAVIVHQRHSNASLV